MQQRKEWGGDMGDAVRWFALIIMIMGSAKIWAAEEGAYKDYCNGATDSIEPAQHGWYWNWENDVVGVIKSDNSYSQGAQVGYTFKYRKDDPNLFQRINSPLCRLFGFKAAGEEGYKVIGAGSVYAGQQIYTPRNTELSNPIADDRPYAGWGFIGFRQELLQPLAPSVDQHRRWATYSLDVQLGVVGSAALGKQTQRKAHDLDGSPQSNGWDHQIKDRFGGQAFYNFSTRALSTQAGSGMLDFLVNAGAAFGNVQQSIEAGFMVRFGRNMGPIMPRVMNPSPFTSSMIPTGETSEGTENADTRRCAWLRAKECYVFAGVQLRGVRHNVFLEPAASGAGAIISPEPLVYEFNAGARIRYDWVRFDYISNTRSREFNPAPANPLEREGRHDFGSFSMSCYGHFGNNSGRAQWICPTIVAGLVGFLTLRNQ